MMVCLKPGEAKKLEMKLEERLKLQTPSGGQAIDLTFLRFDQALTRNINWTIKGKEGTTLYNRNGEGVLKIVEKKTDSGIDLLFPGCYKEIYNDKRSGCRDLLSKILKVRRSDMPAVVSFFMDVHVAADGQLRILPSSAGAGDYVIIEALKDVVVGVTCCPDDVVACPNPSEITIELIS